MRVFLPLSLLLACSDPPSAVPPSSTEPVDSGTTPVADSGTTPDTTPDTAVVDTAPPEDTAEEEQPDPTVNEESIEDQEVDTDWLFTNDTIHVIEITLPTDSVTALNSAPYTYAQADISIDGIEVDTVGMRLRGKIGSFRPLSGKPKIKIDFNQFVEDQRFYGLEGISLNNSVVDCSYMKEVVGYQIFEAAGVPHSRTGYARVSINGADYGLFVLIETPDDRFLARNYPDPTGNLYDGKYVWYGGYSYTLLDFGASVDLKYALEEGTDVGNADIVGVSAAYLNHRYQADYYSATDAVLDWDEIHLMWAAEQWTGQEDGYCMNKNNNRVYFDPTDGKMEFIPWDLDYAFLEDYAWGRNWNAPYGNLAYACYTDTDCRAGQKAAVADMLTRVEAIDWDAMVTDLITLTQADIDSDPRRECSSSNVTYYQGIVRSWVQGRSAYMRTFWGL